MPNYDGVDYFTLPSWRETEAKKARKYDVVGLRNPSQTIVYKCLNGITTITPNIRYLSLRALIVYLYAKCELPDSSTAFAQFSSKIEAAMAIGIKLNFPDETNVIGATRAQELVQSDQDVFALQKLVKTQTATSIYTNSSIDLGIYIKDNAPISRISDPRGRALLDEIYSSVEGCKFIERTLAQGEPDSATRGELFEFGQKLSLKNIPAQEKDLLVSTLLPIDQDQAEGETYLRIATYTILLMLGKSRLERPSEVDLLSYVMQFKDQEDGIPQVIRDAWLAFLIRDTIAYTHESILEEITRDLKKDSTRQLPAQMVINKFAGNTDHHENLLRELSILGEGDKIETLRFLDIFERLESHLDDLELEGSFYRWNSDQINEVGILDRISKNKYDAFALVPIVWTLAFIRASSEPGENQSALLSYHGDVRFGLEQKIIPTIERWNASNVSYLEVIAEMVQQTVDQHTRIAWARMSDDPRKDIMVMNVDGHHWQYKEDYYAGRTEARIAQATGWLDQIGLLSEDGTTTPGQEILAQCRAYLNTHSTDKLV